ncbi:hypothetical protein GCM10010387_02710 [Streptomyces inusitatus]|uniref:Uncharacterized protein n=1 Tax=Streptomyces inusitatus TaxID=68221 RepID=A0A918PKD3_9ACTN|nr:hypothetical protein GCM10010387_02710 [Streptomyces inusitatus]
MGGQAAGGNEDGSPQVGCLVYDTVVRRTGVVMEECETYYALRPPQGGREWDAPKGEVRPATEADRLSSALAEVNARSSQGGCGKCGW